MAGRLRAAGSMSGMVKVAPAAAAVEARLGWQLRSHENRESQTSLAMQFGDDPAQYEVVGDGSRCLFPLL